MQKLNNIDRAVGVLFIVLFAVGMGIPLISRAVSEASQPKPATVTLDCYPLDLNRNGDTWHVDRCDMPDGQTCLIGAHGLADMYCYRDGR